MQNQGHDVRDRPSAAKAHVFPGLESRPADDRAPEATAVNLTERSANGAWRPLNEWRLTVVLQRTPEGASIARESVRAGDLDAHVTETWFHALLRCGRPDVPRASMQAELQPQSRSPADGGGRVGAGTLAGFRLRPRLADGSCGAPRRFSPASLQHVAERGVQRLFAAGRLKPGDPYYFSILAEPGAPEHRSGVSGAGTFRAVRRDPALTWVSLRLDALRARSERMGEEDPTRFCDVFFTRSARWQAERLSRRGAQRAPAVETGAALIGTLAVCPESAEMFVIVTHALEVADARETEFSLEYSSSSWQRIAAFVDALRQRPGMQSWRLLGQAHGHNFLPLRGAAPCEACSRARVCSRTSAFVSREDMAWMQAVFAHAPYALSHIYGLTARHLRPHRDEVDALFSLCDGRLLPRGYAVIDSLEGREGQSDRDI